MKTFTTCAEKKAKQFLNLLQGYTKGIRMTAILVLLLTGASNAWAGITAVAVEKSSSTFFSYNKVKMNIDHKGTEADEWETLDMTKLAITIEGKDLYIKEYSPKYGESLGALQFQLHNNSGWVDENMPISGGGWTTRPSDKIIWDYNKEDSEAGWYTGLGFESNSNFYFDATDWPDISNIKLCIAHLSWHEYYELTNIPNTKLYYVKHPGGWGDAMGISVVETTDRGGQGIISEIPNSAQKYTGFRHWGFENAGSTAYFMVNNGDRGEMPDMYYYGNYGSFNHDQTIKTAIKNANGNYVVENSKATISIKSYKMTGNGVVTEQNNSLTTLSNTATISAARTATTTLTVDWGSLDSDYKFEGWYDENGELLTADFTYEYYPIEENTIYARFKEAPSRTVYFKPNKVLNKSGDRFVACWEGHIRVAEEMEQIECSEYYKYEIPGKYEGFEKILYYKIKTDADDVFDSFSEIDDAAGETADLSIPATNEPNKLYDMSKVYLKPNNTGWESDGARFAAYFWVKDSSPVQEKWMSMFPSPEDDGTYYCDYPTDHAYDYVIFCRMNPEHTDNKFDNGYCWNKTNDLCLYKTLNSAYFNNRNINKGYGNLFQINSFTNGTTTGEWKNKWTKYTATTTVTLVADSHGTYKVTCSNGTSQTSALNEDRTLSVPLNSTITIETVQPQPGYAQTHGAAITIGTNSKQAAILGNAYAICGATTITGNFVAEKGTIYLEANANWNTYNARFFAHVWHDTGEQDYEMTSIGKYFSCTLEDDYHSIVFYRKNPDGNAIWCQTNDLFIPTDNQRIYEITSFGNGMIGDNEYTPAEGTWKNATALIKIYPCEYGQFGIVLENETIWCDKTEVKSIEVPLGTTIKIIDFTDSSISPEYMRNPRYRYSTLIQLARNAEFINLDDIGLDYTVTEDMYVCPNIVTAQPYTVYLHIPESFKTQWNGANDYIWNTMYLTDHLSGGQIIDENNDDKRVAHLLTAEKDENLSGRGEGEYWRFDVPAGYHTFVIERKNNNKDDDTGEGKVGNNAYLCSQAEYSYFRDPLDKNNVYTLTEKTGDKSWIGTWGPLPNCTVELGWCPIGKYGVMYDGKAYYSTTSEPNTSFEVPYGSELTFIEGKPVVDIYDGGIMVREPEPSKQRINDLTQPYRVTSDVLFDDNFVTKKEHVFYLGVPDKNLAEWNQSGAEYYIWTYDQVGSFPMLGDKCHGTHVPEYDGNGYKYYKFTLQPGRNEFRFEHKKPNTENPTGNNSNETLARTPYLTYQVPITNENCYKLNGSSYISNGYTYYQGSWETLPARTGDYRLLYAEKELIKTNQTGEGDLWETAFRTVYPHPSDIIRKRDNLNSGKDTVSLHINTNQTGDRARLIPMVILQQYNGTSWVDIESHTVLPLKAEGNMAMLPGRKKAYGEFPFYSDGIDAIKNDTIFAYKGYPGSGVWNFIVKQEKDQNTPNMITTLLLDKENLKRYEGTYYIRTSNAQGQWANYTYPDNHMTFSSYSLHHRNFSHYYCKWVDLKKHYANVKFTVANDYGRSISDEHRADSYTTGDGVINENANIRWSWNIVDNKVSRAYIRGTWGTNSERLDNLVAKYSPNINSKDTVHLDDTGDWIYSKDIENVPVESKLVSLTATYPTEGTTQTFAKDMTMLTSDNSNENKYVVRILYDFKIDKTLVALVPNDKQANIGIDVLIQRIDQNPATQVQANAAVCNSNGATVYAMMTFNKDKLIDDQLSDQRRFTYWISFPFDVKIDDVFGFSEYGKQWRIREYDGASRAVNGYNGSQTYWKYIDINTTKVLEANKGYILVLNAKLRDPNHSAYTNRDQLSLYFPSANLINNLDTACIETSVVVPRNEGQAQSKDWNWNMIGVPSYANKNWTITQNDLYYFFEYNLDRDSYEVCWAGKEQVFNSMFSYMVQFAGTIDWQNRQTSSGEFPELLAAKKDASKQKTHVLCLNLQKNAQREDRTYIQLMDEKATADFDMNLDLTKMVNANANIYSLAGNHQLAANVLPMEATTVPLGVIIKTAGEYTFAMPDGTDGIVAELIDYQTNTRTNLALDNYTVTLPAGTNHTRFAISLQPDKTVTGIEDEHWTADGTQVRKFLIDGRLYMLKDGVLYDAQGREIVNN